MGIVVDRKYKNTIKVIDEKYQKIPTGLKRIKKLYVDSSYQTVNGEIHVLFHKFIDGQIFNSIARRTKDDKEELIVIYYDVPLL